MFRRGEGLWGEWGGVAWHDSPQVPARAAASVDPGLPAAAQVQEQAGDGVKNPLSVGIKRIERAPTGRAVCFCCKQKVNKGEFRFEYRVRASSSLSDERRVHAACVRQLPVASRAVDISALEHMIQAQSLPDEELSVAREALASLVSARGPAK